MPLVAVIFVPGLEFDYWVFKDGEDSRSFLETFWGVIATTLGLSMAMIGFVFQAFVGGRRLGGSLRDFARATRLNVALRLGFASLICNALVLMNLGFQAPRGWAAFWAGLLSLVTLGFALPYVFRRTLRALDDDFFVSVRKRQVRELAEQALALQLRGQLGNAWISSVAESEVSLRPFTFESRRALASGKEGVVRDIRLASLRALARRRDAKIGLLVELGQQVSAGTPLIEDVGQPDRFARLVARHAVRLGRLPRGLSARDALRHQLKLLHLSALAAIRGQRHDESTQILAIYREILLALPAEAARLNFDFDGAVASPGLFGEGPLRQIARFLAEEMSEAVDSANEVIVSELPFFVSDVARRARDMGAPIVSVEMMALTVRWFADAYE